MHRLRPCWALCLTALCCSSFTLVDRHSGWIRAAEPGDEAVADTTASDSTDSSAEPQPIDFGAQVAPIFSAHCSACHGNQLQESNYRLDVREIALGTADLGEPPIVKGDSQASPLVRYVSGDDPDGIVMPPEGESEPLSATQVATLRAWIDQGAAWPDEFAGKEKLELTTEHWSFQPVRRPAVPAAPTNSESGAGSELGTWAENAIDHFVGRKLQENSLQPSGRADRRTLIRRVYLDLLGLPPTPEEVTQFEQDPSPNAYARLVERALESHHYGERWAQHWLDVVRFGESDGFETNHERPNAYHYRDYVIDAFNSDKPYDEFVKEQIAGDALSADAATGFLVAGAFDIVKSPDVNLTLMQRQDELADMINTTGTAFLGLTVGCARCHNHKFDPILQSDYYSLQAVFAGVQFGTRPMRTPQTENLNAELSQLDEALAKNRAELAGLKEVALEDAARRPTDGLRPRVNSVKNIEQFAPVLARYVRFTIRRTNSSEPCIDELEVWGALDGETELKNVALASGGAIVSASGTLPNYEIHRLEHLNDGQAGNAHSWISDTPGKGWVQIELPGEYRIERIHWGRDANEVFRDRVAIDYTIEVATQPDQWTVVASSADRLPYEGSSADTLAGLLTLLSPELAERARQLEHSIDSLSTQREATLRTMPVAYAGTFQQPGATYRLYRGDPMAKREEVTPDALTVIGSLGLAADTPEQLRRLRLAEWIADPSNPLTARVMVNRIWHHHFGTGIVSTPSDFGANGTTPSHPQLLDWLAAELMENGWSLKHIHRLILMSSTYRQSSQPRAEALRVDADSRFLWRFPPRRLEAEAIRDSILFVAGTLNQTAGGPGFNVFDVQKETVHHYFPKESFGPDQWRRMVYMTKIRQERDAVFGAFDCPDGGQVIPQRTSSTTPLQALNLLNSRFVLQQADYFAKRLQREAGEDVRHQVQHAFQLMFGRDPTAQEADDSIEFARQYGLPALCRALLNANEFLFLS